MEFRQVTGPDEHDLCADIVLRSMNGNQEKAGKPPWTLEDLAYLVPSLAHIGATDPEGLVLAIDEGQPIGFGCVYRRESYWGLSYLYVLPGLQGKGIGRALLDALLPPEPDRPATILATVPEMDQTVSQMLYAEYGIVPQIPLYWLDRLTALDGIPGLLEGVRPVPLSLDEHRAGIDALDRTALGYARPADHAMWAREADGARVYLDEGDALVGYGYLSEGWICPAASVNERLTAGIIRDLLEGYPDDLADVVVPVAGNATWLLPTLLRAGLRAGDGGATILFSSNGRVPSPSYLFYSGYLM